jgi:hypothetical protein
MSRRAIVAARRLASSRDEPEDAGEMALVGKPAGERDLRERKVMFLEEALGGVHPAFGHPLVRRHARASLERGHS